MKHEKALIINALNGKTSGLHNHGWFFEACRSLAYCYGKLDIFGVSTEQASAVVELFSQILANFCGLQKDFLNPFDPTTTISYSLLQAADEKLVAYNMLTQIQKALDLRYINISPKNLSR